MMRIVVNGTDLEVAEGISIQTLLTNLGKCFEHVALECNGEILDSTRFADHELRAEDRLELVHFVGGG
jgi:thiamine biosynthesis protein ThiS